MYVLYEAYYAGASKDIFMRDLSSKTHAVILRNQAGQLGGFSTLQLINSLHTSQRPARFIYSGDTIIDKAYWGRNDFAQVWLRLVGQIKSQFPDSPLYWLLIVKGHRTYRYLSLFAQTYYPNPDMPIPADMQALLDEVATQKFGDYYHPDKGLVLFPEPRSYLREEIAAIPSKDKARSEVRFFLEANPGYAAGDELVCICELSAPNLTRLSRVWFVEGMTDVCAV